MDAMKGMFFVTVHVVVNPLISELINSLPDPSLVIFALIFANFVI